MSVLSGDRVAIWSQNIWVVTLLVLIIIGHWSLILQGISPSHKIVKLVDRASSQVFSWLLSGVPASVVQSLIVIPLSLLPLSFIQCVSTLWFCAFQHISSPGYLRGAVQTSHLPDSSGCCSLMAWYIFSSRMSAYILFPELFNFPRQIRV
jgi:hypothetical protein